MVDAEQLELLYNQALRFLAYRPRSRKEIQDFLTKKIAHQKKYSAGEKLIKPVFKKLRERELINDRKFAIWWCEQRSKFRPRSPKMLVSELRQKGISVELAKKTIAKIIDEKKLIKKLLVRKKSLWEELPPRKKRRKAIHYFLSRGFSWTKVETVIDSFFKKE